MKKEQVLKRLSDLEFVLWKEKWATQKMLNSVFKARLVIIKDNKTKPPNKPFKEPA